MILADSAKRVKQCNKEYRIISLLKERIKAINIHMPDYYYYDLDLDLDLDNVD